MSSKKAQDYAPSDSVHGFSRLLVALTQSGTAAPSATERVNETGTTFTYARSSAGVYTITAAAPVFTAGKTDIFVPDLGNALYEYKVVNTSTTVITITTSVISYSLGVVATPTDALLDGKTFEVRIYD